MSRHVLDEGADPIEYCFERGWTDGLPVVPPTPERVEAMLAAAGRPPDAAVGELPERGRVLTVEKAAVNAVMAGCRPEHFPVVLAAMEAAFQPAFGLHGPTASTGSAAILVVVHGPIARRLGLVSGRSVLGGHGNRSNAAIGRAVRLILMNVLGSRPEDLDHSTLGNPAKVSYCIAEQEEWSPWPPLHVDRGLRREDSAVTVMAAEAPQQVSNHLSPDPEGILGTIAARMCAAGTNAFGSGQYLVVLCPEHVATLRAAGWSKEQVRAFLYENAYLTRRQLRAWGARLGDRSAAEDGARIPAVPEPHDIMLLVAGGHAGRFSAVIASWAGKASSAAVTRRIQEEG